MSAPLPALVWPLLFGNFVIGTGVMVVPGTLNEISASLDVSVATAGQLISAGAVLMALGAPLLAAVVAGWDRRRLLALPGEPGKDAADALGLAICHAHAGASFAALSRKTALSPRSHAQYRKGRTY